MADTPEFARNDRVRHITADLVGTVTAIFPSNTSTAPDRVRVRWDHDALAYSALGALYDMPRVDFLQPYPDQPERSHP